MIIRRRGMGQTTIPMPQMSTDTTPPCVEGSIDPVTGDTIVCPAGITLSFPWLGGSTGSGPAAAGTAPAGSTIASWIQQNPLLAIGGLVAAAFVISNIGRR